MSRCDRVFSDGPKARVGPGTDSGRRSSACAGPETQGPLCRVRQNGLRSERDPGHAGTPDREL